MRPSALGQIGARVATFRASRVQVPAKTADPLYHCRDYKSWRRVVIARAGGKCEEPGCTKAEPRHRMFADHKVEVKDGGARFDPANGRCLCGSHHSSKTAKARAARR